MENKLVKDVSSNIVAFNSIVPCYEKTMDMYKETYPLYTGVSFKNKEGIEGTGHVASSESFETEGNFDKLLYIFPDSKEIEPFFIKMSSDDLQFNNTVDEIKPWIGFDLDATIAEYFTHSEGLTKIGAPIFEILNIMRDLINKGWLVKIFTARASFGYHSINQIKLWLESNSLDCPVTNLKDGNCVLLFDDRAFNISPNTGFLNI